MRPYPNTNLNALRQSDPEISEIREKQRNDPELSEKIGWHYAQQRCESQKNDFVEKR